MIIGNSPFRPGVRRSLVYVDWSSGPNHPSLINRTHVKFFEEREKVWIDDEWGAGEVLFARTFSDDDLVVVDQIDEMIRQKAEHSGLRDTGRSSLLV